MLPFEHWLLLCKNIWGPMWVLDCLLTWQTINVPLLTDGHAYFMVDRLSTVGTRCQLLLFVAVVSTRHVPWRVETTGCKVTTCDFYHVGVTASFVVLRAKWSKRGLRHNQGMAWQCFSSFWRLLLWTSLAFHSIYWFVSAWPSRINLPVGFVI